MRMGLIFLAFAFGCIATAFIRVTPPNANANNAENSSSKGTVVAFALSETQEETQQTELGVVEEAFGQTSDGRAVKKFICSNDNGYVLELMDYGATIVAMHVPSKDGKSKTNVTLSCADMAGYDACTSYFGATCGRYCNRIAKGKFSIDGKQYTLATNGGPNHLHGGKVGFDKKLWQYEIIKRESEVGVRFKLTSPDGDEGYPGEVKVVAEYTIDNKNQLKMVFKATTDAATHVNLCNHAYWNIGGAGSDPVTEQLMTLNCDKYVEFGATSIPTGNILAVEDSEFLDFRNEKLIGAALKTAPENFRGYDHCLIVNRDADNQLAQLGSITDPKSGRTMTVYTTQPGFQLYSANHFDGQPGSGGFEKHGAICFETQHYPDSPNRPQFPTTLLKPGETMVHTTIHKFSYQ